MKNKEKNLNQAARIYDRESRFLNRIKEIENSISISQEELLQEYSLLGKEYSKLLKQMIKITGIGDANHRKLLVAKEQIEQQQQELRIAYNKLEMIARTDPLTQVANRRHFLERFGEEIDRYERNRRPFSMSICDIDNFKMLNDTYGHDYGDYILVNIAKTLKNSVRKLDTVGRWGGEEFVLLLPSTNLQGGRTLANTVRKKIAEKTFTFNGHSLSITMTFGVSQFDGKESIDQCIKRADEALYAGKKKGKNCVVLAVGDE